MNVIGYKCFKNDLVNNYGIKFNVGKKYSTDGIIKFGLRGNGYHLCKNLEDTFRYFDTFHTPVNVCLVEGRGNIDEYCDEYYGYYDMYSVEQLEILRKLSRDEIINYGLNLNELRAIRFVSSFKLTEDEIKLFEKKYALNREVINAIKYYQKGDKAVYELECAKRKIYKI